MSWLWRWPSVWFRFQQRLPVRDHDLNHHVGKLDVHDRRHRFLFRPEQGGTKADAKVGHRHQILVGLLHHVGQVGEKDLKHPLVGGRQLLDQAVDLRKKTEISL